MSRKNKKKKGKKRDRSPQRPGRTIDPHAISASIPEYYQATFYSLVEELHDQIEREYLQAPAELRREYFKSRELLGQTLKGESGFEHFKDLIREIEDRIASKLRSHSVFFWLHLYRRIGVALHPGVEANDDANTLALVRLIVEAAIQKYGRLDIESDVRLKGDVPVGSILGGLFEDRMSKVVGKESFQAYANLLNANQWVLVEFTPVDYVSIYAVEGLAYQYWRCTAKMRALAKGSEVYISPNGDMVQTESPALYRLIESYDRRISNPAVLFSNAGLIARVSDAPGHPLHNILECSYNVRRLSVAELPAMYGPVDDAYIPNFLMGMLDAHAYLNGHSTFAKPFEKKYGISLHHVIALLAATSAFALGRLVALDLPNWRTIFELTRRAYRVLGYSPESLTGALLEYAQETCKAMGTSTDGLPESVDLFRGRYTLTSASQVSISLWTYGPRAIFIPYGNAQILDVSASSRLLINLFFGVRDTFGKKGFEFEDSARQYLEKNGVQVLPCRVLENRRGDRRETDIAVRVGDTLILCDCRTIDRPLDIEIGVPGRLEVRQSFLEEKLDAVESIAKFVEQEPMGANYDFSWAKTTHSVGVSPFVEWIWSEDERHWIDRANDIPRLMSITELEDWLSDL